MKSESYLPLLEKPVHSAMPNLRRLLPTREKVVAPCDVCGAGIPSEHDHLLEVSSGRLLCSCQACAILFSNSQAGRFRRVPRQGELLQDFQLTDAQWESLLIPINLAFFYRSSAANRVIAVYPSPAGATESLLELANWQELAVGNPVLDDLQPDVESLLVNRVGETRDHYRVSIDRCYELIGLIRVHWRGLSGGREVWEEINAFFERLNTTIRKNALHV
jgi:hypothetical protein